VDVYLKKTLIQSLISVHCVTISF